MSDFRTKKAFEFYRKHILNEEKLKLLKEFEFRTNGAVSSQDWELFAAILSNKKATAGYGADLPGLEVKSAKDGNSFEYQYHKNAGLEKLEEDMEVEHLFISYSASYLDVTVRLVQPSILIPTFKSWKPLLEKNYDSSSGKQRFRRSISFKVVSESGQVVMKISDGKLVKP
jgi:hypothetical protein